MKTLCLLRHAKSDWTDPALGDFDRPLAPRGRMAAPRMAAYLHDHGLVPDHVLCSTARRAMETWDLIAPKIAGKPQVETRDDLYLAGPVSLLETLQRAPRNAQTLMLIGHNPGMEILAEMLVASGSKKDRKRLAKKYVTAGLAVINFEIEDWAELATARGILDRYVRPKDL